MIFQSFSVYDGIWEKWKNFDNWNICSAEKTKYVDATSDRSAENSSKCHSSFLKSVFYDSSKIDISLGKG